jgi:acyl-CoA thioesterase I
VQSVALDSSRMQEDGLHPKASGEPAVLDTLWPQLVPLLKKDR